MQTQKDHVDAHAFLMGRMASALVTGDESGVEAPAKRAWTGLVAGAVIAALIVAGFAIFGLLVPAHATADGLNPGRVAVRGGDCPAAEAGEQGERA